MSQIQRMLYRDSAEAGEKRTNEERGEAESKAVISSLNSIELSEKRFRRWETVPFAAHGVPKMPFGDRTGRAPQLTSAAKSCRGRNKNKKTEKEKKQHEKDIFIIIRIPLSIHWILL